MSIQNIPKSRPQNSGDLAAQVRSLADQVKILALNMAIQLARSKERVQDLTILESDFTKLIHGSIEVIQEITMLLEYLQCRKGADTVKDDSLNQIEHSLNEILNQSRDIQEAIEAIKHKRNNVDKNNR